MLLVTFDEESTWRKFKLFFHPQNIVLNSFVVHTDSSLSLQSCMHIVVVHCSLDGGLINMNIIIRRDFSYLDVTHGFFVSILYLYTGQRSRLD